MFCMCDDSKIFGATTMAFYNNILCSHATRGAQAADLPRQLQL